MWLRRAAFSGALVALLSAYYAFTATAGKFDVLTWHTDYYDLLAESFRAGRIDLLIQPSRRLLAKADPYDYKYVELWLWDAVLFDKRYYFYWGPIPALCLLGYKVLSGALGIVHDQWLVLCFMIGRLIAGTLLILSVAHYPRTRLPDWAVYLAIGVFALASPTPYFIARPLIYEASISAGQCFLFWGLLAAFWGIHKRRWRVPLFVFAGACWSAAFGSRGSLLLVAPLLCLITAYASARDPVFRLRAMIAPLFLVATPVALGLLAHGVYNYARFGTPLEFGLNYQLTWRPFMNDTAFLLPNLVSYLGAELAWSCRFPFARLPKHRDLTSLISWPVDYDVGDWDKGERVAGVLVTTTFCWLTAIWLWRAFDAFRQMAKPDGPHHPRLGLCRSDLWVLLCSCACMVSLAPASRMYMANMRFLEDAAGGLILASVLAGFWLLRRTQRSARLWLRAVGRGLYVGLAAHTIVIGLFLGFSGYMNNFQLENPQLHAWLRERLSTCRQR